MPLTFQLTAVLKVFITEATKDWAAPVTSRARLGATVTCTFATVTATAPDAQDLRSGIQHCRPGANGRG